MKTKPERFTNPLGLRTLKGINDEQRSYHYAIIVHNSSDNYNRSVLLSNNYKRTKYCMIDRGVHKDGSESEYFIIYSNDLEKLQNKASKYVSWYNYPIGLRKEIQGGISDTAIKQGLI